MFDFSTTKQSSEEIEFQKESSIKLDMNLLLEKIDLAQYNYYDELSDKEKKHFTPYTVLRWVSALDDSTLVTYNAKKVEAVFGKWSNGGKESLNELRNEFVQNGINVISVAKYEHAKFDWRIKFAVPDLETANALIESMKEFSITGSEIVNLIDSTTAKYHLIMLNEMVNEGFWSMKDHPDLVYQLLCSASDMVGAEKRAHTWLPFPKGLKNVDKDIFEIIKSTQSTLTANQLSEDEYKILLFSYDKKSFDAVLSDMGYQDSDRKGLLKQFKTECEKYGKES
jgi:hypothetical protein